MARRAVRAPLESVPPNAMSLEGETQQPSYHVKAAENGLPAPFHKSTDEEGDPLKSRNSDREWMLKQKELNARKEVESLLGVAHQPSIVADGGIALVPDEAPQHNPSQSLHPGYRISSSPVKRLASPRHPNESDELVSSPSPGVAVIAEGVEEEPSLPTPPDSCPESLKKATFPLLTTPSKRNGQQPISHYSPTEITPHKAVFGRGRAASELSPSRSAQLGKRPIVIKALTPRKRRKAAARHSSPDSFGEPACQPKIPPLQRLDQIFEERVEEVEGPHHDDYDEKESSGQAGDCDERSDPKDGGKVVEAEEATTSRSKSIPAELPPAENTGVPSDVAPPPNQETFLARRESQGHPAPHASSDKHVPKTPTAHQNRFQGLPLSGTTSSPGHRSHLFSDPVDDVGAPLSSLKSQHFTATQAVSHEHHHSSPITTSAPARSSEYEAPSTRHSTGPSVPIYRRLARTIPAQKAQSSTGDPKTSQPARTSERVASKKGMSPSGAALAEAAGIETAEAPSFHLEAPFSSSVVDEACLQDTFIDRLHETSSAHPTSPIVSAPIQVANPSRQPKAAHATSRKNGQKSKQSTPPYDRSSPAPEIETPAALQATFIDERGLPPPPPAATTPKQYGKVRKRAEKRMEDSEQLEHASHSSPVPEITEEDSDLVRNENGVPGKGKAKAMSVEASEAESSPVAEDHEDNTYRPSIKPTRQTKGRAKRPSAPPPKRKMGKPARASSSRSGPPHTPTGVAPLGVPDSTPAMPNPGASLPPGCRVFGWWAPTKSYFPGIVNGREGDKFRVDFLDDTRMPLRVDGLRRCELRKGDLVQPTVFISGNDYDEVEVEEDWDGNPASIKIAHEGVSIGAIRLEDIHIRAKVVNKRFADRLVTPALLGNPSAAPCRSVSRLPTRISASPVTITRNAGLLTGKDFLITMSGPHQASYDDLRDKILTHGGTVIDDWIKLFDMPEDGFGSTFQVNQTPFLLVHGNKAIMKPKMMAALAKGIPCLAVEYIEAVIQRVSSGLLTELTTECSLARVPRLGWTIRSNGTGLFSMGRSTVGRRKLGSQDGRATASAFQRKEDPVRRAIRRTEIRGREGE